MMTHDEQKARRFADEKAGNPLLRAAGDAINAVMPEMSALTWLRVARLLAATKIIAATRGVADDLETVARFVILIDGPPVYTLHEAVADELNNLKADAERAGFH